MDSTSLQKKRPVETLTYDNWEEWFYLFEEWAKGESIDFVLRKTVQQYAYTFSVPDSTPTSSESSTSLRVRSPDVQDLLDSLNIVEETPLLGEWSQPRLEKFVKAESKMRYTITICVDDIDAKSIKNCDSVRSG
jgi:hypothetical protein